MKNTLLTGSLGMASLEFVNQTDLTGVATNPDVIKLILQIVIGLITLVKMTKKDPKKEDK